MNENRSGRLDRRTLVGGLGATLLAATASPTIFAQIATPSAATSEAEWIYTDDIGQTIALPEAPKRLLIELSTAAALWDFGIRPAGIFGWAIDATNPDTTGPAAGNIEFESVEILADAASDLDPEKVLLLDPDLIITLTWRPDEPDSFWGINESLVAPLREIAPIIALSATGTANENVARFADLAASLGIDLESPELVEAKTTFDATTDAFAELASEKSDIVSGFYAIGDTAAYLANPGMWADLSFYQGLGLNIMVPDIAEDEYWIELSLERLNEYDVDILFQTARTGYLSIDKIIELPTANQLPAIQTAQIHPWNQDMIQSYQGMTAAMDVIIEALTSSEKVTIERTNNA